MIQEPAGELLAGFVDHLDIAEIEESTGTSADDNVAGKFDSYAFKVIAEGSKCM